MSQSARRGRLRVYARPELVSLLVLVVVALHAPFVGAQSLPSGWTGSNVGSPAVRGRASYSGATFNVEGAGTRIGLAADQFYFVYQRITGNVTITARVTSVEYTHPSAKAGVMIRESLTTGSRHAYALVTPARGIGFHRRIILGRTAGTNVSGAAPVWLRLVRSGSTFTALRSNNGTSWTIIARATIAMKQTVYVGLAVSSYDPRRLATGMFTNVGVKGGTPAAPAPGLTPPKVSLTSPTTSTYTAPATIGLVASASDPDGVAQVEFYANNALLGIARKAPYGYAWFGVGAGTYSLTAVARDSRGAVARSAARTVTVKGSSTNTAPTVSLTAPAAGSTYTAPAAITIAATARDSNGTVARVDFFAGSTLVGSDTTSPYTVTWKNAPAGSFSIVAVARDNGGATTTSAARTVSIASPPMPRRAIFSPSPDHATVTRYVLDIFTAGANPARAQPIATRNLGKPSLVNGTCSVDIASTISSLPGGNYFATVVAVGPGGTSTRAVSSTFAR